MLAARFAGLGCNIPARWKVGGEKVVAKRCVSEASLTCNDSSSDEKPRPYSKLVYALEGCFKAWVQVGEKHAMYPDVPVQGGSEIPFWNTHIAAAWSTNKDGS